MTVPEWTPLVADAFTEYVWKAAFDGTVFVIGRTLTSRAGSITVDVN